MWGLHDAARGPRNPRRRRGAIVALALGCCLSLAAEEGRADETTTADALFLDGRAALKRGDFPVAVERFTESQRLSPAAGTLLNLAIAEEKLGRLAAAWEHARSALAALPASDERQALASNLHASLAKRLPHLVLTPHDLPPDARVALDGVELRAGSFGARVPVDPGRHEVRTSRAGHADQTLAIDVAEGETREVEPRVGAPLARPSDTTTTRLDAGAQIAATQREWRTVAVGLGGAGILGLVAGAVLGGFAMDRNTTVEAHCQGRGCDQAGFEASREGSTFATGSTIAFAVGGGLLVAGIATWLFAPR